MINPMDLSMKRILVAGASSGIGRETAILISKLGGVAILVARREEKLLETLSLMNGDYHSFYCFDLKETEKIGNFVKQVVSEKGPFDGLVFSVGIGSTRPLKMMGPINLREVMEINFYPFVELVRSITKKSCYNPGLSIVGVSSVASVQGNQGKTAYCASKAAMDGAMRCMAKELAPKRIRVNNVCPSLIDTAIFESFLERGEGSKNAEEVMLRQYLGIGKPIDVANMIAFLLSEASSFITGSAIGIDGGRLSS